MFRWFPQKKQSLKTAVIEQFDPAKAIPQHVAIIMDGNGRWAQNRRLPRIAGHKEGMNTVKKITKIASQLGVKVLSLYAFSTENWRRPSEEVSFLMQLPVDFFDTFVPELMAENVRVEVIGFVDDLPEHTRKAVFDAIAATKNNTGMVLNFALNYGSRAELVAGVQQLATAVQKGELEPEEICEESLSEVLMTQVLGSALRDPDLLIRTSGEERLSNFMLWQLAYSEFVFFKENWPDFDETIFKRALAVYQGRQRRFGGLKNEQQTKEKK